MSTSYDQDQADEVLALLQARGPRGIRSTESVDLGIPGLQQRVGELREQGWPIESRPVSGTRLVDYVLTGPRKSAKEPIEAGVRIVVRGGVPVVTPYAEGPGSAALAAEIRSMLRYLRARSADEDNILDD